MEAFSFCEQPVKADHLQAVIADDGAEPFGFELAKFCGVSESEGSHFKAGVSMFSSFGASAGKILVTESFVADGKAHAREVGEVRGKGKEVFLVSSLDKSPFRIGNFIKPLEAVDTLTKTATRTMTKTQTECSQQPLEFQALGGRGKASSVVTGLH